MKTALRHRLIAVVGMTSLLVAASAPAFATDRVLMKAPAKDTAFVDSFTGFKNGAYKNLMGTGKGVQEGLVIRKSRVENGKIIIPPSGLYYTTRTPLAKVLQGDQVMILGEMYTLVENGTRIDVIKDVEISMGPGKGAPIGDGTKQLEYSSVSPDSNGFNAPKGTFQILKPSGNYYGTSFTASTDPKVADITKGILNNGTKKVNGSYKPGEQGQNWQVEYYDSSVATSGQSYLLAGEVGEHKAKIKEFATGAIDWMLLTEKPAVEMVLGAGETASLGNYTVKVTNITRDSASVELIAADGKVLQKTFGPNIEEVTKYLPADPLARDKFTLRPASEDVQLQLNLFNNPFRNGKVALVGYTDLFKLRNPGVWPSDPRFIARPDT